MRRVDVKSRDHGKRRAFFCGCTSYHLRGRAVCANQLEIPMAPLDDALLTAIEGEVLHPDVVTKAVQLAADRLRPSVAKMTAKRVHLDAQIAALDRELERLTAAVASGGEFTAWMVGIRDREVTKAALVRRRGWWRAGGAQRGRSGDLDADAPGAIG
ncbi:MAG: hypothetical protein ABR606_02685 [Vicinamibacterales bacterium]